jgi:hypothetical protein
MFLPAARPVSYTTRRANGTGLSRNRALDRGEDPAVIKQKIAAFRHDKHNPADYAERTVDKAEAARNRSSSRPPRRPVSNEPNF